MEAQVLMIDLTFGDTDVDNDTPPLNAEICHFDNSRYHLCRPIVLTNN